MKYFGTLPKLIQISPNGSPILLTNIMARASIISDMMANPMIYYTYDIQEKDTPEIIAHKYYGDVYRYWIVLLANQIIDPQWQWPMDNEVFGAYIADKYQDFSPYSEPYQYYKIITQRDLTTDVVTEQKIVITGDDYADLLETNTTYNLPTGNVVVTISKQVQTYYDYEVEKNESNRNIKLVNSNYVTQIENELKKLMEK